MTSRPVPPTKEFIFKIVTIGIGLVVAFVIFEIGLRLSGTVPMKLRPERNPEFVLIAKHPRWGWQNRPGQFPFVHADPTFNGVAVATINPDGGRSCAGSTDSDNKSTLLLLGGSFTFGWAVDDSQVLSCLLQNQRKTEVTNWAVAGFGTYQSMLVMEDRLANHPVERVIYGFYDHHEDRNIATGTWRYSLNVYQGRTDVEVPYVSLSADGSLIRQLPLGQVELPLRRWFSTPVLFERVIMRWNDRERIDNKQMITFKLIETMATSAKSVGASFTFVVLNANEVIRQAYSEHLRANNIDFIDCHQTLTPANAVPVDGHPDASVHRAWAKCIDRHLNINVTSPGPGL
ncbi:MAG: hypothetical protein AAF525_05270 [Pseudomonadota bacterium]